MHLNVDINLKLKFKGIFSTETINSFSFVSYNCQKRSNVPVTQATTELLSTSACVGADCLMKLLGNYCRNIDIKTAITVGVVGMNSFQLSLQDSIFLLHFT